MIRYIFLLSFISQSLFINAQIHVRDEPRHHNVFENHVIRILDVYLPPGDTSLYHLHNTPSVFIILANAKVGSQLLGGRPQVGANLSGTITYDKIAAPRTHKVWNADTNWFHVMDIELTAKKQTDQPVIQNEMLKLLFNEKEAIGYNVALKKGSQLQLPAHGNGYLFVSLADAIIDYTIDNFIQPRLMKAGHYIWVAPGKTARLSTSEPSPASFVLLQLK